MQYKVFELSKDWFDEGCNGKVVDLLDYLRANDLAEAAQLAKTFFPGVPLRVEGDGYVIELHADAEDLDDEKLAALRKEYLT